MVIVTQSILSQEFKQVWDSLEDDLCWSLIDDVERPVLNDRQVAELASERGISNGSDNP